MQGLCRKAELELKQEWGDKVTVVCAAADAFLAAQGDRTVDVLVVDGLLDCCASPLELLVGMARVAEGAICIEGHHCDGAVAGR